MIYLITTLKGILTLAFFIFVAASVNPGFDEIVVGGLGLIYFSLSIEISLARDQISNSHLGLSRIILAVASNIKDDYLKEEVESSKDVLVPLEEQSDKKRTALGIDSIFGIILIVLSFGLIIKGSIA